jgi:hypothetical protein
MTQKEQPTIADEPGEYNKSLSNFNGGTMAKMYLASGSWVELQLQSAEVHKTHIPLQPQELDLPALKHVSLAWVQDVLVRMYSKA